MDGNAAGSAKSSTDSFRRSLAVLIIWFLFCIRRDKLLGLVLDFKLLTKLSGQVGSSRGYRCIRNPG